MYLEPYESEINNDISKTQDTIECLRINRKSILVI